MKNHNTNLNHAYSEYNQTEVRIVETYNGLDKYNQDDGITNNNCMIPKVYKS